MNAECITIAVPVSQLAHGIEVGLLDRRQYAVHHFAAGSACAHAVSVARKLRCIEVAVCINPRWHNPMMHEEARPFVTSSPRELKSAPFPPVQAPAKRDTVRFRSNFLRF